MKGLKRTQILLPSVALASVLSMPGTASASQTPYMQTKAPGTNATELTVGSDGDGRDDGGRHGREEREGRYDDGDGRYGDGRDGGRHGREEREGRYDDGGGRGDL
jgi:hypothetical protein